MHSLTTLAGYNQLIDQSTHVISNFSSYIDLIFASNPSVICNSGIELSLFGKCHHDLIFGELIFVITVSPTYKKRVWDYKKAIAECIRRSISSVDSNFFFHGTSVYQKVMIFNKH